MKRAYDNNLDETIVENYNGTQIILDMIDVKVLDFSGTKCVKFTQLSSGLVGFTPCARISGPLKDVSNFQWWCLRTPTRSIL